MLYICFSETDETEILSLERSVLFLKILPCIRICSIQRDGRVSQQGRRRHLSVCYSGAIFLSTTVVPNQQHYTNSFVRWSAYKKTLLVEYII